ncbi:unnamed protein product, partial [Penicillium discolor]
MTAAWLKAGLRTRPSGCRKVMSMRRSCPRAPTSRTPSSHGVGRHEGWRGRDAGDRAGRAESAEGVEDRDHDRGADEGAVQRVVPELQAGDQPVSAHADHERPHALVPVHALRRPRGVDERCEHAVDPGRPVPSHPDLHLAAPGSAGGVVDHGVGEQPRVGDVQGAPVDRVQDHRAGVELGHRPRDHGVQRLHDDLVSDADRLPCLQQHAGREVVGDTAEDEDRDDAEDDDDREQRLHVGAEHRERDAEAQQEDGVADELRDGRPDGGGDPGGAPEQGGGAPAREPRDDPGREGHEQGEQQLPPVDVGGQEILQVHAAGSSRWCGPGCALLQRLRLDEGVLVRRDGSGVQERLRLRDLLARTAAGNLLD